MKKDIETFKGLTFYFQNLIPPTISEINTIQGEIDTIIESLKEKYNFVPEPLSQDFMKSKREKYLQLIEEEFKTRGGIEIIIESLKEKYNFVPDH